MKTLVRKIPWVRCVSQIRSYNVSCRLDTARSRRPSLPVLRYPRRL